MNSTLAGWTQDNHNAGIESTELQDTFSNLKEACAEVKRNLPTSWSEDFFVEYEVQGKDGTENLRVEAECPEGEVMHVYIEKKLLAGAPAATNNEPNAQPTTTTTTSVNRHATIYILIQETKLDHTDEETQNEVVSGQAYDNLLAANEAAWYYLRTEVIGMEDPDDDDEMRGELDEENVDSTTEKYIGSVYHHDDEIYGVTIRVEILAIRYSDKTVQQLSGGSAATSTQRKRKKENDGPSSKLIDLTSP